MTLDRIMKWLRGTAHDDTLSLVNSDAEDLIAQFGDSAYYEARTRARRDGPCYGKPPAHWAKVKRRIRDRLGLETGLGAADRYD